MPYNVRCSNCYHLQNDWCIPKRDSPDEDIVRDCQYYKVKTRADCVRAMTDEELAAFFDDVAPHDEWTFWLDGRTWLDWLRSEAEEEDDGRTNQ